MSPLKVENLSKRYDDLIALDNFNIELKKGEIFGLLGPNGAGKTTFISILTGLVAPTEGKASVFDFDIIEKSLEARKQIGLVPQEIISHGFFTVNQVLNFHSGYYGIPNNQERIDYLLEKLALDVHRNKLVSQLSGGMKRRLLIAKALVHSPPLLLLDEPTAGVDVELRTSLWEFVRELNAEGMTILLTTHYLEEAEELCNRIGVLNHGKLIKLDETKELIKTLTVREIQVTIKDINEDFKVPQGCKLEGNILKSQLDRGTSMGEFIKSLAVPMEDIIDINIENGTLEEAFVNLLKQHEDAA